MKQTLLGFGQVVKASKKSPVNVCVHEKLHTMRMCKRCYTITVLWKRCKATTSATTGQSLDTYGTKEQLLSRLINNAQLCKAGNVSDDQFFCIRLHSFTFVCIHLHLGLHLTCLRYGGLQAPTERWMNLNADWPNAELCHAIECNWMREAFLNALNASHANVHECSKGECSKGECMSNDIECGTQAKCIIM